MQAGFVQGVIWDKSESVIIMEVKLARVNILGYKGGQYSPGDLLKIRDEICDTAKC